MPRIISLFTLCIISLSVLAQKPKAVGPFFSDGPYLFYQDKQVLAKWMERNQLKEQTILFGQAINLKTELSPDFSVDFEDLENRPVPQEQVHFQTEGKIAALSDVHGQYDVTVKLLRENGIINQQNNWIFGNGHLVIVGDVMDRGEQVTEIFWLLHRLEKQAPRSGGRVHLLLGNHELMVLSGDYRYVHKKYRYSMAILKQPLSDIYSANSYLGAWLRSKPIAITINDMAFVHGGFSEFLLEKANNVNEINKLGKKLFSSSQDEIDKDSLLTLMNTMNGPLWYRGYFDKEEVTKRDIDRLLKQLGKRHIIVGHTSHEAITPLYNNKIFGVDSSIKFGKSGEIPFRDKTGFSRGTITGERIRL